MDKLDSLKIDKEKRQATKKSGINTFLGLLVFVLTVALGVMSYRQFMESPGPAAIGPGGSEAVDLESAPAEEPAPTDGRKDVLVASGYVVAHHRISLGSKVIGRVAWMGVEKGDIVEKGQLLVKLEDGEFRAQRNQAEALRMAAETRLEELERGTRPQEIQRAEAELRRAKADLKFALLEFERFKSLNNKGVLSDQELDNARARFEMADATAASSAKQLELLRLGPRKEAIERARADARAAQASLDYFQTLLDATEIRAPIDGTVLARIAEIGEMITTSFAGESGAKSAVVSLADLNDLQVELDISQTDFNRISPNHGCEMSPEAYPDRLYACRIDEIAPEANRQKATIQVKVKVLEPDEYLRPEMSATVTFFEK